MTLEQQLLIESKYNRDALAKNLLKLLCSDDVTMEVFELVNRVGDEPIGHETFLKAADLILQTVNN